METLMEKKPLKIIMLILSSDTDPIYTQLQESWKVFMKKHPQIDCWFYKADPTLEEEYMFVDDYTLKVKCEDGYGKLYTKMIKALKAIEAEIGLDKYDYFCRPNESSFFIFDRYLEYLQDKPRTNVGIGKYGSHQGVPFLSGCGFTLSMDVVKSMIELNQKDYIVDDVTVGIVLKKLNVKLIHYFHFIIDSETKHRFLPEIMDDDTIFHIRCKHEWPYPLLRHLDVKIHKKLAELFYRRIKTFSLDV